jgi:hypothetical protein
VAFGHGTAACIFRDDHVLCIEEFRSYYADDGVDGYMQILLYM